MKLSKDISLWEDSVRLKHYPRLEGVAGCEVLIIGGGMAGILTAHRLAAEGVDVTVAEAGRIGCGVTAGTTAKITSQHGLIYQKLVSHLGTEGAALYLKGNEDAIGQFAQLCEGEPDNCDFRRTSSYIYSMFGEQVLEQEMKALEQIGCSAARLRSCDSLELPFDTDGAVEFPLQACFHPRKLLKHVTEGEKSSSAAIFENSRITRLKRWPDGGWEAISEHGSILADQVIFACHFPFMDRRGGYFAKMYQSRSLVIAGWPGIAAELKGMYMDEAESGLSFRSADGMILLGGGSGRPGKVDSSWQQLQEQAKLLYPGWETRYRWAAQDCMTLDGMPYIGPYYGKPEPGEKHHGLWTATGFNKWGMTGSMVSAMVLTDLICGRKNEYAELFRPDRSVLKPQLALNVLESTVNLLKPKVPRCRHLGCALTWNEEEQTWECPCHGSRYDKKGQCIEGPSVKNLF